MHLNTINTCVTSCFSLFTPFVVQLMMMALLNEHLILERGVAVAATSSLQTTHTTQTTNKIVNIGCDSISNYRQGRIYCIIKNVRANENTTITYEPSYFSKLKTELLFDNCKMHSIPRGIFKTFANLKTMYTWNSGLAVLNEEDFLNADNLKVIDLSHNDIELLKHSTFFQASYLEMVNLSQNKIRKIEQNAFHGLIWLRHLYLYNNQIEELIPGTFTVLPKLETLQIHDNLIKSIHGKLFLNNPELSAVHLYDNRIRKMDGDTFQHLEKMKHFDLHNNPIENLQHITVNSIYTNIRNTSCHGAFIGKRTVKLYASNNHIEYVVVAENASALVELDLSLNNLTSFANLTDLEHIKELDLSNNQIFDIGIDSFAAMSKLESLKLKHSGLQAIDFGLFSHKTHLKVLDISYNNLSKIDLHMFTAMTNLRSLYFEGNQIRRMDMSEIRKLFPSLTKIGISKNNWNCTNLAIGIKVLESFKIELNTVGLVRNKTNIKGIPCTNVELTASSSSIKTTTEIPTHLNEVKAAKLITANNLETNDNEKCRVTSATQSTVDMDFILPMMQMKYELVEAADNLRRLSDKLNTILDMINVGEN